MPERSGALLQPHPEPFPDAISMIFSKAVTTGLASQDKTRQRKLNYSSTPEKLFLKKLNYSLASPKIF
jgi:hypothetical protein